MAVDEWTLTEGGLRYRVDLGRKQNNGLFLDMRIAMLQHQRVGPAGSP